MKTIRRKYRPAAVNPPEVKSVPDPLPAQTWPYPIPKRGQNDQNRLAPLILRIGYHLQRLRSENPEPKHEQPLRAALEELCDACLNGTRAHLFATSVRDAINAYGDPLRSWNMVFRIASSMAQQPSIEFDPDPARKWFFVGQNMVSAEAFDRKQLNVLSRWLKEVATETFSEEMRERAHKTKCTLLDVTLSLMSEQSKAIWQPSTVVGRLPMFNGRELKQSEYKTLELLAIHGRGEQGMTYVKLEQLTGSSTARNAVAKLRTYSETKGFINGRGRPRFVGECAPPPSKKI